MDNEENQHIAILTKEEREFIVKFRRLTEAEQQKLVEFIMNKPFDEELN